MEKGAWQAIVHGVNKKSDMTERLMLSEITWHSCTDHVADHTLLTELIMHTSRFYHALLTWLVME